LVKNKKANIRVYIGSEIGIIGFFWNGGVAFWWILNFL